MSNHSSFHVHVLDWVWLHYIYIYRCPHFNIPFFVLCLSLAVAGHIVLLTVNIGLSDSSEVFGSNDLGRETIQPDSLLSHAIDGSFNSIYMYLKRNRTAFYA